jgi:Ca-activated chloride channel family protein
MKFVKLLFVISVAIFLCAAVSDRTVRAQASTGSIVGKVTSAKDGHPLAYANVIVMGTTLGAMSLENGSYNIKSVPAGKYAVKAMMMGFKAVEKKNIVVKAGEATEVSFVLDETIVMKTQEIVVTAEKKMVEVNPSCARGSVTSEQLEEMPVDDVLEAVALKAGIVKQGGEMHVRGGRSGETQIQIDGRPVDDPLGEGTSCEISRPVKRQAIRRPREAWNTEGYDLIQENEFRDALEKPFSTFSIDVDAASYSNARRYINAGQLPPADAVRIEEMINYFSYDYPDPGNEVPFSITAEVTGCPWNDSNRLVHIGLQGKRLDLEDAPASNLVFLIDVSGSMQPANKLPLLKKSFKLLVDQLRDKDRIAIVVYASSEGLVLESTSGDKKKTILRAIEHMHAGGSTAGGAGIKLAYKIAEENFIEGGNNRVILATDGDFNTGVSSDAEMVRLIEEKRKSGVFITVLGFGVGNLKDSKMEKIADHGNGNYAYIDGIFEARKVLVNELGATLFTIAKDVKIQVEFNPAKVKEYRLIGYENRVLKKKDFDDDKKDAGEIGAGHSVTALYEIVPADQTLAGVAHRRATYTTVSVEPSAFKTSEILTVRFRYKAPDEDTSTLLVETLTDDGDRFEKASVDFRFAAAVAEFGMLLRGSQFAGEASFEHVLKTAKKATGDDEGGHRHEFVRLVEKSREIMEE